MQQEVKHTMDWRYDYEGRHGPCRQRIDCTRCGFTEGKTLLRHRWDLGVEPRDSGYDYTRRYKVYTCEMCSLQVVRYADQFPPRQDAHD
jgi:hypothetical protein